MDVLVYGVILLVNYMILKSVSDAIPTPFIDEIFHIPQAQKYCRGIFNEWNDKITTPPGLYILSLLLQLPILPFSKDAFCSAVSLRAVNVFFNFVNMLLVYQIMKSIHINGDRKKEGENSSSPKEEDFIFKLQTISISIFPVLYFYSFLYYTDAGSTAFVLAAYLANLKSLHKTSALLGLISLLFRQTNIVWVAFMAGTTVAQELMDVSTIKKIETSADIQDKLARFLAGILSAVAKYLLVLDHLLQIIKLVWPYMATLALFCGFVVVNGGIVLGDKSNHEVTFHGPQLLYFLGFTLCFAFPILVSKSQVKNFFSSVRRDPVKYVIFGSVFLLFVVRYTQTHIFLLSDNRHYTFYLWRYFLKYQICRLLMIPLYLYSGWSINKTLNAAHCTSLWKLVYTVCVIGTTLPQKLIEPRYFIIPYMIFRINLFVKDERVVVMEFILHVLINVFTLVVFLNKTFPWADIEELQRIMW